MQRRKESQGLNFGDSCIYRGGEWTEKKKNGEGIHSKSHRKPGKCGDLKAKRAQYFKEEDIANFVNYSNWEMEAD